MRLPTLLCIALATVGALQVSAQTAPSPTPRPTPPAPPFVNDTADFSAWIIARYNIPGLGRQSAEAVIHSAATPPKPESLTNVTKTGQVRHQTKKLSTSEQEDVWYEHGNRITMESIWKIPMFQAGGTSDMKTPVGLDFPELTWLAAGNFVGTQVYQNVTYFVFETQLIVGNAAEAKEHGYELKPTFNRAYINAETRLPWLLQTGDALQRFAFQAAPTAMLEAPPEYQAMFDTFEKKKIEAARKPVAP